MQLNTEKALNKFWKNVIKQTRSNLTKQKKNSSKKTYNSLKYNVKVSKNSFETSFFAVDSLKFIDKGVRGAGGVRKSTSNFNNRNNKGKLWKIKAKNSIYKFGKSGGISPKHFQEWAKKKGLSPFAVAKAVYHQGIETTNVFTKPFENEYKKLPDEIIKAYALDVDTLLKNALQ